ncbi:MAG: GNAT family N-acetyltransferase [Patescibacteria group bacterium]
MSYKFPFTNCYSLFPIFTQDFKIVLIDDSFNQDIYEHYTQEVAKYMFPRPYRNIVEVEQFVNISIRENISGTNCQCVILSRQNDFIGLVGLHNVYRIIPEIGVWLRKEYWGQGIGRKAVTILIKRLNTILDFDYIRYPVHIDNVASQRIPESLNAAIVRDYNVISQNGNLLKLVEYRIDPM